MTKLFKKITCMWCDEDYFEYESDAEETDTFCCAECEEEYDNVGC